jgi:hypothetical protein
MKKEIKESPSDTRHRLEQAEIWDNSTEHERRLDERVFHDEIYTDDQPYPEGRFNERQYFEAILKLHMANLEYLTSRGFSENATWFEMKLISGIKEKLRQMGEHNEVK